MNCFAQIRPLPSSEPSLDGKGEGWLKIIKPALPLLFRRGSWRVRSKKKPQVLLLVTRPTTGK